MISYFHKRLVHFLAVGILFVAVSLFFIFSALSADAAISVNNSANLIGFNSQTMKASSTPVAVIGLNLASSAETLTGINLHIAGSSGFSTSTDIAAFSVATSSGIALYRDNKSSGIPGMFDSADMAVLLSGVPSWTGATTTLTFASAETVPVNDAGGNFGNDYFVVVRTATGAVGGHVFTLSLYPGEVTYSASTPTATPTALTTSAVTIDNTAPTIDSSRTAPTNGLTNVPVSAFINVAFSENIDTDTVNSSNVSLTTGGSPVGIALRTMPDAFSVIISNPPTYATSSRFAKVAGTSFGFYNIFGTSPIMPFGLYVSPTVGDIVYSQHDTFPAELGIVTNATMTSGTFAVNDFALTGGQSMTKFATPTATGAITASTVLDTGDLVVVNTQTNPTSDRYAMHIVTTGGAVNGAGLRVDGSASAPTYISGSSFSSITPTATSTIASSGELIQGMNFVQGDMVFARVTVGGDNLNTYAWHIVTTAENVSAFATSTTLRLDDSASAVTFTANSAIAKLTSSAQGAVTDSSTTLSFGDIVLAKTTANAANNGSYFFHFVSNEATGASSANLRFDNSSTNLATGAIYTLTIGTGVKDQAGNPLATSQTISFTTGSTGGTNTTPPFVVSLNPTNGSQSFPTNVPINIQFSQDMASLGIGSVLNSTNVGLYSDNFGVPGTLVSATNTYDASSRTVTITPSTALGTDTGYVLKVANTTASSAGAQMGEFVASFKTSSGSDSVKPTVLGVFPTTGATSVARNQNTISIGFSEDMNPTSITSSTVTLSGGISSTVSYKPSARTAYISPTTPLAGSTTYTVTVTTAATDMSGNALDQDSSTGGNQNFTSTFTTSATADSGKPSVLSANADNFGVAVTFSEAMKSGGGPNAVDNIANYTIESPVGSSISLGGKTVTYDGPTMTAKISGLSLQTGNTFKVLVAGLTQDISSNNISTTGTPPANTSYSTVADSASTGGQLGPGDGPQQDAGEQGMSPVRVTPENKGAGSTSKYSVEFPVTTSVPIGGSIVLTFPSGFDVSAVSAATAGTESFRNSDLNGPKSGTVTIASVTPNSGAGTVTIVTGGAVTGANTFLALDLKGIVNSTIPNSAGYTVGIKTRDTSANNNAVLENKTSAPFFLGQLGSNTLSVEVFHDDNTNGVKDSGEQIVGAQVFLFSPAVGGSSTTTIATGVATFSNLPAGDYMLGINPGSVGSYAVNPMPQPITISGNITKKYALGASGSTVTISGTVTGTSGTKVDVFGASPSGFTKTTITLTGGADNYSLPVEASTTYQVGVGPAIPASFMAPGAIPPPPPTFTFMPPANLEVKVASASVTGKNFNLSSASKTIAGKVLDANGSGVNMAGVFARPVSDATSGGSSVGFGTGGQTDTQGNFTLNVVPGVYIVGVAKPGMPSVGDKQVTVPASGANTPSSLVFNINAGTSLTITGSIKDDSGNAIPYAGVSARKVNSTSDTTAVGGGTQNFISGQSDTNGAYTLYVDAGNWVVEAYAPGFGRLGEKIVTVGSSSLSGQDFSAQTLSLGTIVGQATKAGVVQQGVMVRAEGVNGVNMVSTDVDGNYSLKMPAGTYSVTCLFPGVGEATPLTGVAVTASATTSGQNCSLGSPITITVNLTDGTNPIDNAFVDVRDSNGRGNSTSISTASSTDAVYAVTVPPGTYTVRVGHPAYGNIGTTASVNSTRSISYTASAGQIYAVTGTVKDGATALSGAWVSIVGIPTSQTNTINVGGQTAADGTFSVNVPAGSYNIRADKPGYKSPAEAVLTVSGATSAGIITLATASRTIAGTVTIAGAGVSGAFVDANDGSGGFAVSQTDASGAYSLAVDNGTWVVRAHSIGYEGGPTTMTVNGSNLSGQTMALSAISGFTVKQERQETITPAAGGLVTNSDIGSAFKMDIPANALGTGSNAGTIKTQNNTAVPTPSSGAVLSKNAVTISAVDASGQPIKNLNNNIVIVVPYTEADIPTGQDESTLVLGVWNNANQTYNTLPTTVDTTANTLTAEVSHFSDFVPMFSSNTPAVVSTPSSSASASAAVTGGVGLVGSDFSFPGAVKPRKQIIYPDGRIVYLDEGIKNTSGNVSSEFSKKTEVTSLLSAYLRSLFEGSEGQDVTRLQTFLESKGFLTIPQGISKGYFGSLTKTALVEYQKSVGISPIGIFGPLTRKSVEGESAGSAPVSQSSQSDTSSGDVSYSRSLSLKSEGQDVTRLQTFLESKGFLTIPQGISKGYFGSLTKTALVEYQKSVGISPIGIFGPLTRKSVEGEGAGSAPVSQSSQSDTSSGDVSYSRSLSLKSEGQDVTRLQTFLESKGFLTIPQGISKGYFGSLTKTALVEYQKSVGISPIGIFGPLTRKSVEGE